MAHVAVLKVVNGGGAIDDLINIDGNMFWVV